jgi:nucleoprotein TPR
MRTRRKSKAQAAAAAAAAAEHDFEPAGSVAPSEVQGSSAGLSKVEFSVSIPDDFDLDYLSKFLPDVSFESPSPDTVLSLYRLVVSQAVDSEEALRELEELRAENERKDIELDQALQDRESSVSSLETQCKGLQEELVKVKQERDTFGESNTLVFQHMIIFNTLFPSSLAYLASSKSNLESQLSTLNSSQSISSTELDSFRHKVEDTEREKRDLLGVVSRLKEDGAQRDGMFSIISLFGWSCAPELY